MIQDALLVLGCADFQLGFSRTTHKIRYTASKPLALTLTLSLRPNIAQKPLIVWSLGPKASKYESIEPYLKDPKT